MTRSDCINASVLNGSAKGRTTWLERRCSQWKRQFGRGGRRRREQRTASWELVVESRGQRTDVREHLRSSIGCFISGITLVSSVQATDATNHPGLVAPENEK